MKKDPIAAPLLPFTDAEEAALSERLTAMDPTALGHYVESARQSLGNRSLDASWRPRIQVGLDRAEAVLLAQSLAEPPAAPAPAAAPAKAARAKKAAVEADDEAAEVPGEG